MRKLIIISHSEDLSSPVISTFHTNSKAVQHVGELVSDEYGIKPDPDKDVLEYVQEYYSWVQSENDNMCEVTIDIKIVEIEEPDKDKIIEALSDRLSKSNIAIDDALEVLKEHGLGQHEEPFALELAAQLAPNETLLIEIEKETE